MTKWISIQNGVRIIIGNLFLFFSFFTKTKTNKKKKKRTKDMKGLFSSTGECFDIGIRTRTSMNRFLDNKPEQTAKSIGLKNEILNSLSVFLSFSLFVFLSFQQTNKQTQMMKRIVKMPKPDVETGL